MREALRAELIWESKRFSCRSFPVQACLAIGEQAGQCKVDWRSAVAGVRVWRRFKKGRHSVSSGKLFSPRFEALIAPARAHPQLWRIVVGLGVALAVYLAVVFAILLGLRAVVGRGDFPQWLVQLRAPSQPDTTLLLLATFIGMVLGAMAAAAVHWRRPSTLFGPWRRVVHDFLVAAGVALVLNAVSDELVPMLAKPVPNLAPSLWLKLLPLALGGVLLQVTAEEMLFRGYLQSQLAARFRSPLIWLGLPALLFGLGHYNPASSGANAPLIVLATLAFGLIAGDLTRVTGSLGASIGLHFANNVIGLLLVSVTGTISGLSLYTTPFSAASPAALRPFLALDLATFLIIWLILRRLLRR